MPKIEINTKKNLAIHKALKDYMGWENDKTFWTWRIKSPTQNLYFAYNSFNEYIESPQGGLMHNSRLKFKISDLRKVTLDTDAKMLIIGNGFAAINVA